MVRLSFCWNCLWSHMLFPEFCFSMKPIRLVFLTINYQSSKLGKLCPCLSNVTFFFFFDSSKFVLCLPVQILFVEHKNEGDGTTEEKIYPIPEHNVLEGGMLWSQTRKSGSETQPLLKCGANPKIILPLLPSPSEHIKTWKSGARAKVLNHVPVLL